MKKFYMNRGQWAEWLVVLKLTLDGFVIEKEKNIKQKIKYINYYKDYTKMRFLKKDNNVQILINEDYYYIPILDVENIIKDIEYNIYEKKTNTYTTNIKSFDKVFENIIFFDTSAFDKSKIDIDIVLYENDILKKYSLNIKSLIWNMPSLLNASYLTKFTYKIENINKEELEYYKSINSSRKIIDKVQYLRKINTKFSYYCDTNYMKEKIRKFDNSVEFYIAKVLLYTYILDDKNVFNVIDKLNLRYPEKLYNFFNYMIFDYGKEKLDGLVFIEKNSDIYLVKKDDKITKNILEKYIKFDTPSTRKYKIAEFYILDNMVFFDLYLQIKIDKKIIKK